MYTMGLAHAMYTMWPKLDRNQESGQKVAKKWPNVERGVLSILEMNARSESSKVTDCGELRTGENARATNEQTTN
jgi:hypothetical protein